MTGLRWHYLRDWVKVARELPKKRGDYPDGAIVALVFSFCKASEQPTPGSFESVGVLRAILDATGGRRGRWVPYLVEHGDLVIAEGGVATLPNWLVFQEEGRSTHRVQKHRATRGKQPSNADETLHPPFHETEVKPLAGAGDRGDSSLRSERDVLLTKNETPLSGRETRANDATWNICLLVEELTSRPFTFHRGNSVFDMLAEDVKSLGAERVSAEYRAVSRASNGMPMDAAGIVFGAHKRLFVIPDPPGRRTAGSKPKGLLPDMDEVNRAFDH